MEPVNSAVKANISIEANQFCLHQLFLFFFNFQNVHTKVANTYSNKINVYKDFHAFTYHFTYIHFTYHFTYIQFNIKHCNENIHFAFPFNSIAILNEVINLIKTLRLKYFL